MKYIRYEGQDGLEHVVIFDAFVSHDEMFRRAVTGKIISAGKCHFTPECFSGSVSLNIKHSPKDSLEDQAAITKLEKYI